MNDENLLPGLNPVREKRIDNEKATVKEWTETSLQGRETLRRRRWGSNYPSVSVLFVANISCNALKKV